MTDSKRDDLTLCLLMILFMFTLFTACFTDKDIDAANKTIEYLLSEQEASKAQIEELTTKTTEQEERILRLERLSETQINRLNYHSSELSRLTEDTSVRYNDLLREVNSFESAVEDLTPSQIILPTTWTGSRLTRSSGVNYGASGRETYYNLDMSGVVATMRRLGYSESQYPYWIREDGCKMLGNYIMVAANLRIRPRGTILETSLGWAIVCDTGGFVKQYPYGLDIATNW